MEKKDRMLAILYTVLTGGYVSVPELAKEYQVSGKSIFRDISAVRQFLADNRELVGNVELEYNSKEKGYRLTREDGLQDKEILVLVKILLGCRAMPKKDMHRLTDKLSGYISNKQRAALTAVIHNECAFYQQVRDEDAMIMDKLWQLEGCVRRGKTINISYDRLDGKHVSRKLYPIATSFSEHYFYLIACRADISMPDVIYYRIDRIKMMEELNENIPIEINERHKKEMVKMYTQNMFIGERMKIKFQYTGPSLQAVLDRFPTAHVVRQGEGWAEISAMVEYSRGTVMELLSQGSWIRVLSPDRLVEDMNAELKKMCQSYKEKVAGNYVNL